MSELAVNSIVDASSGNTVQINGQTPSESNMQGRNRIINGDMRIDQRNNGAAVTINSSTNTFVVDRFMGFGEATDGVFTLQQSAVAPEGFTNSLLATVTTADSSIGATQRYFVRQAIEGFNTADLGWGTASASTVTLSFYVRSSLTGTFGGSFMNDNFDRANPFTYTISAANTWEQKSITLDGDTTGTWLKTNGGGIYVIFSIGAGSSRVGTAGAWQTPAFPLFGATGQTNIIATNGATWQITGVQLEAGAVATPFERRPFGAELALCQRYLPAFVSTATNSILPFSGCGVNSTAQAGVFKFDVQARVRPTGVTVSSASHFTSSRPSTGNTVSTAINFAQSSTQACQIEIIAASGLAADVPYLLFANSASGVMLFTGCEL